MQSNFDRSLSAFLKHEGGYVNHKDDPGGPTNLGITIETAKRLGIDVDGDGDTDIIDIKLLKPADAAKVYKVEYWDKVRGDDLPSGVDYAVSDFAINSGPARAAIYLQNIVGAAPDGKIGPLTLKAVTVYVERFGAVQLINELCSQRLAFLERLSTWPTFGKGWRSRVIGVRELATQMAQSAPKPFPQPPQPDKDDYPHPIPSPETPADVDRKVMPKGALAFAVIVAIVAAIIYFTL